MSDSSNPLSTLEYAAEILIRCFWYSALLLMLSLLIFMLAGNAAFQAHSAMFGISKHEFVLMYYYGTAFLKITVILFFLIPYLAIRAVLKKHGSGQKNADSQ